MKAVVCLRTIGVPALFAAAFLLVHGASGQERRFPGLEESSRPEAPVTGEITGATNVSPDLYIELVDSANRGGTIARTSPNPSGNFEFNGVPIGDYELRLVDRQGNLITAQFVRVTDAGNFFQLRLPELKGDQAVSGVVSLSRLTHKVPGKAEKEFHKGETAGRKGKNEEAIEHFNKAIEIDPAYMEAYNNLGARYIRAREPAKALEEFKKAYELDHTSAVVCANMAIAQLLLEKYADAEKSAREAVKLNGTSNKARFALGVALASQSRPGADSEAIENLQAAAREFPRARLVLAQIMMQQGDRSQAVSQLREYLQSGKPNNRAEVETWIARLQQAQPH